MNIQKSLIDYWEDDKTVSIIDKNLHELEITTVLRYLSPSDYLADIGCGDGKATVRYAKRVALCVGIERSNRLRNLAKKAVSEAKLKNTKIIKGDILKIKKGLPKYDVVVTQRLLINLASWKEQMKAIDNIFNMLKPGGRYIMIENTNDSFQALNDMRADVGLTPIPQHWHNRFFDYNKLEKYMENAFQLVKSENFGLYYFLTRIYSQMFANFKGYGSNAIKDPIFERSDRAAKVLYQKYHNLITFNNIRALGPIQVFIFRRELQKNG